MFELPLSMFPLNVDTKYSVLLKILQFSWNLELKFSKVPIVSAGSTSEVLRFTFGSLWCFKNKPDLKIFPT